MRDARYPLAAARTQRDHARQLAQLALRDARDRMREGEAAVEQLRERAKTLQQQRTSREAALTSGLSLARHATFASRLGIEQRSLERQLSAALTTLRDQQRAARLAELALEHAHAERELIERHHADFRTAERKASELVQELESEELRDSRRLAKYSDDRARSV
jgi:hypothetical protein